MSLMEIFAALFSAACVWLAIKRNTLSYPLGIIGTILYFFVFWGAHLYSSAWLQVFFTGVQVYGWWYWLRGDHGKAPPITEFGFGNTVLLTCVATAVSVVIGTVLSLYTNAQLATFDTTIFGLSVIAQFLLDRKKLENWLLWILIDAISVLVYFQSKLYVTGFLYVAFFVLASVGWFTWAKAYRIQTK